MSVSLRPLGMSDIDDFMVWATDDNVSRFCSWNTYTSVEAAKAYINGHVLPHPYVRAICLDGWPVGTISLAPGTGSKCLPCRAWLRPRLCPLGPRQAVKMVVSSAFDEWPELERVEALVDVQNPASQRVLEKAGFYKEGALRKYYRRKGRTFDMVMYSFLATDPRPSC